LPLRHFALYRAQHELPETLYYGLPLVMLKPSHPEVPATIIHQLPHGFMPRVLEYLDGMELVDSSIRPDEVTRLLRAACGDLASPLPRSLSGPPRWRPRLVRVK
jgi:hypothetical protein